MLQIVIGRNLEDLERFGSSNTVNIGRHLVVSGGEFNLTSPVLVDILRPHVTLVCGKRGSGKSYTMGVFIEEILKLPEDVKFRLSALVIDTQGIFWSMKTPAEYSPMLSEWKLVPQGFPVKVYVPVGVSDKFSDAGIPFDGVFSIRPSQLSYTDWISLFELEINNPVSILLRKILDNLPNDFNLDDMINEAKKVKAEEKTREILLNLLEGAKYWGIFGEGKMPELLEGGVVNILDVSLMSQAIRTLLVSILGRKIFEERTEARRIEETTKIEGGEIREKPMIWIFIDEAHNFVPSNKTVASSEIILKIVKEGRQPGISLFLATQQVEKIHRDVISQADLIISHRITSKNDIDSLKAAMQAYVLFDIEKYIEELPKIPGTAIILDDNSERLYKVKIRPRQSWHAGESPLAIYKV